ncbi:MAG: hypothetical protein HON65_05540 [Rhodospirillales bacterium]|jgi:hypothetical protein|nr:hypothetical protein [Rhodospirillales bacterium]
MTIKPKTTKTTKKPVAKASETKDTAKTVSTAAKTTDKSTIEKTPAASTSKPIEVKKKSGPVAGVLITLLIFAGLVTGAGVSWNYWWPYVEPLLPKSDFNSDPLVAQLQNRVEELESQQQEKNTLAERELAAFQELEKERAKISEKLAAAITRLESVEASVQNVEQMAVAVSTGGAAAIADSAINQLSERLKTMEMQSRESTDAYSKDQEALANISKRIESLEVSSTSETTRADGESDSIVRASALVLAVGQLRTIVREGRPYSAEMAAVVATVDDEANVQSALDVLERRANAGVIQLGELRANFEAAILEAVRADHQTQESGWINDVLNKLSGLVTIRKIDGLAGLDSVDARISQAQSSLGEGDLVNVISVIEALEGPAAEAFALWLDDARTYVAIEKALDDLYSSVIAQLSSVKG